MSDKPETGGRAADDESAARMPRDAIAGIGVLLFCLATYLVTIGFKQAPPALAQNVQPATFPRLVLAVMAVLAIVIIFNSFRGPEKRPKTIKLMVWPSAAVMIGFIIAFDILGILPAMMLLCFGLPILWGERRLHLIIPYAIGFPLAIYWLFAMALGVHFEPSPLAFW
jgi:putative tricarboxylic transport membrane protein